MLQRAAILIGVEKTGGLPRLGAVQSGVEKMRDWAARQPGMLDADKKPRITILSDAGGVPVTAQQVRKAVSDWVADGTIEQLLIYFAGHGANVRYGEYWLLSGAPDDANDAVNVAGSLMLGRNCGIPHVVMISDACRTAAASTQSQAVQGSLIFPNTGPRARPGYVDIFYATLVGQPALEVSDPNAASGFDAVYTTGLIEGLSGKATPTNQNEGGRAVQRVQPWPLKSYLEEAVPELLMRRGVQLGITQAPDAIISSPPNSWLAELVAAAEGAPQPPAPAPAASAAPPRTRGAIRGSPTPPSAAGSPPAATRSVPSRLGSVIKDSLFSVSRDALRVMLGTSGPSAPPPAAGAGRGPTRGRGAAPAPAPPPTKTTYEKAFESTLAKTGQSTAPGHFETRCGFKVDGIGVSDVVIARGRVELLDAGNGLVRLWDVPRPATNVLVVFADGRGALIPAIPDFIASLSYESVGDGELANVTYEPSDNSPNWQVLQSEMTALRELRRVVAAAARLGVFRPDAVEDRIGFVDRLRDARGLDPTMAVYAAYALQALQQFDAIEDVQRDLRGGSGLTLFDVAMLARSAGRPKQPLDADAYPAIPLLSQGWALLDAFGVTLPPSLEGKLLQHLESSLWTLFNPEGVKLIRAAISSGGIN